MPSRLSPLHVATGVALILGALVATSAWAERNAFGELLPHGFCFTWLPSLLWLHVISDGLTALAYLSIPVGLWHFARARPDLPFPWIFLLFGTFIVACGATHLLGIWNVWVPDYWLSGSVKALTAAASVPTAVALFALLPRAIALPSTAQLHAANESLRQEVAMRREAEDALRRTQLELESRVEARTRELADASAHALAARAEAEAANRSKDDFIAMLSHELRNPMAPIANAHRILERTQALDDGGRAALQMAVRQTRQLQRLVDDLLDTTRLSRRGIELRLREIDVVDTLGQVLQVNEPIAADRGQPFAVSIDPRAGAVVADPARLQQVLQNLLSNAFKFTRPADAIRLDVRDAGDAIEIEVADQGVGIDADDLPRIFDLFTQADRSLERSTGGLGIGLAWVKAIVESHGGTVRADSAGADRGAKFVVRWPRGGPVATG